MKLLLLSNNEAASICELLKMNVSSSALQSAHRKFIRATAYDGSIPTKPVGVEFTWKEVRIIQELIEKSPIDQLVRRRMLKSIAIAMGEAANKVKGCIRSGI